MKEKISWDVKQVFLKTRNNHLEKKYERLYFLGNNIYFLYSWLVILSPKTEEKDRFIKEKKKRCVLLARSGV